MGTPSSSGDDEVHGDGQAGTGTHDRTRQQAGRTHARTPGHGAADEDDDDDDDT